jgi:hypothetical protein
MKLVHGALAFSFAILLFIIFDMAQSPVDGQNNYQIFAGGRMEMLMIISIILALIAVFGFFLLRAMEQAVKDSHKKQQHLLDARIQIRLGYIEFGNYEKYIKLEGDLHQAVALSTLLTCTSNTERALNLLADAENIIKSDPSEPTPDHIDELRALAAANLGYFYSELYQHGPDTLKSEYCTKAINAIEDRDNARAIHRALKGKVSNESCAWWDIHESLCYTQFHCGSTRIDDDTSKENEKRRIAKEIKGLINNVAEVPQATRNRAETDWGKQIEELCKSEAEEPSPPHKEG